MGIRKRTDSRENRWAVSGWCRLGWVVALLAGAMLYTAKTSTAYQTTAAEHSAQAPPAGTASNGRELFFGTRRFAEGGPACASCHRTSGIRFPNGGALGPELTGIYGRFGPEALQTILQTLYFPTMAPIFADRQLTPQEQSDLTAFFQQTASMPPPTGLAAKIILPAVGGFLILLAIVGGVWRKRLRRVRRDLVEQVQGGRS